MFSKLPVERFSVFCFRQELGRFEFELDFNIDFLVLLESCKVNSSVTTPV